MVFYGFVVVFTNFLLFRTIYTCYYYFKNILNINYKLVANYHTELHEGLILYLFGVELI